MILLIGSETDPHVQAVRHHLKAAKAATVLLDVYQVISAGFAYNLSRGFNLTLGQEQVQLSDVRSVWWRQKAKPQFPAESSIDLYNYNFSQREWNTIFDYVAAQTTGVFSVNDRVKAKIAENKAFQLDLASKFDFRLPRTIITNNFEDAARFFRLAGVSRCVYKTFSPYMPPNATIAYTTELDLAELSGKRFQETSDATPGIFQELIESAYELRVTVVGEEIFCARIDPRYDQGGVDWRISLFANKYSHFCMPKPFDVELLRYHAELGLVFAAYDFIVSKNDDLFFLEANPSGQWMWLEQQLGLPISRAVAEKLRRPN